MNIAVDDEVVSIERLTPAPPQKVFELWTDPEKLVKWWGPDGFAIPAHALDVRPGGNLRTMMKSPDGSLFTVSGRYRTIDPPRRLVFTWAWDDDKGARGRETEVTVMFHGAARVSHSSSSVARPPTRATTITRDGRHRSTDWCGQRNELRQDNIN